MMLSFLCSFQEVEVIEGVQVLLQQTLDQSVEQIR